jgi:hypothetical protein
VSQAILNQVSLFNSFFYNEKINTFVCTKHYIDADINEMLAIVHLLDNHFIPYKITSGFNIRVLKTKRG